MDILIKPEVLSLAGAMNRFVISAQKEVVFELKNHETGENIVQHSYAPNKLGRIEVDIENIVAPLLSFELREETEPYKQPAIARKFKAVIKEAETEEKQEWSFVVLRAGIDRFADAATNFLKANFLTWQPTVKPVTYYTPEFLTYYAQEDVVCKCKDYVEKNGKYEENIFPLGLLAAGAAWTIPVQYAIIAGKINALPSYYDVWIENTAGERLTYIQRYYAADIRSEQEQWVLFENSLGGIDTFRAYGNQENTAKHTHNIAEIENVAEEYRVDTERLYKKNTGFLNENERKWLLDFFPSLGKYLYTGMHIRRIVVTESEVSWQTRELPSSYTFTYKYADSRPYLNLSRTDIPAEVLNIKIPDVGSFTVAPRLVELDRLPLSGGALFPVQSPYSDKWSTTTAAAVLDWLSREITSAYKGDGSFGHSHSNISLLESMTKFGNYLLIGAKKISAGLADVATKALGLDPKSSDWDKILRKDTPDTAREVIVFLKGLTAKAKSFFHDISNDGEIHTKDLVVTGKMSVFALEIVKAKAAGGLIIAGPGEFHADLVEETETGYVLYQNAEKDGKTLMQTIEENDQLFCCDTNIGEGAYTEASNRYYWRRVTAAPTEYVIKMIEGKPCRCLTITLSKEDRDRSSDDIPRVGDDLCTCGNRTNPERMGVFVISVYRSFDPDLKPPYRAQYIGLNDYNFSTHRKTFFANNDNEVIGRLKVVSETGDILPVPCDKGAWKKKPHSYYDRVSHVGSLWMCVIEPGKTTEEEPGTGDAWQRQVSKGDEPVMLLILTDKGNIIRNGQGQVKLTAVVTQGGEDITDRFQPEAFSWTRSSGNDEYDKEWNNRHAHVGRSIIVSSEDIWKRAQFECVLES